MAYDDLIDMSADWIDSNNLAVYLLLSSRLARLVRRAVEDFLEAYKTSRDSCWEWEHYQVCHILLVKASYKPRPDSKSRKF